VEAGAVAEEDAEAVDNSAADEGHVADAPPLASESENIDARPSAGAQSPSRELRDRDELTRRRDAASAADGGAADNALLRPRRRKSVDRRQGPSDSSKPLLEQIGVERVASSEEAEVTRLRRCAAGGAGEEKKPLRARSEPLPGDLEQSLTDGRLLLLRCKYNSDRDSGGQPGVDFKNLRVLVHLKSGWQDEICDADFYEYTKQHAARYLLSKRAYDALSKEAKQVRTCPDYRTRCSVLSLARNGRALLADNIRGDQSHAWQRWRHQEGDRAAPWDEER
jgi:hypothetical protein